MRSATTALAEMGRLRGVEGWGGGGDGERKQEEEVTTRTGN
jgi:hypothetical protein